MSKEVQIETKAKASGRIAKLVLGILFDLIGMVSYVIPGAAEFIDIVWAPISGLLLAKMYGGTVGKIGGVVAFLEEILPGTDLIPTFTLTWIYEFYLSGKHKK